MKIVVIGGTGLIGSKLVNKLRGGIAMLIVLGPKRLPEAGRGLGSAIRGFKDSLSTAERREEQPAIQPSRQPDHARRHMRARSKWKRFPTAASPSNPDM